MKPYWVKITFSGLNPRRYFEIYIDALDCEEELGADLVHLAIMQNCLVTVQNYEGEPPPDKIKKQTDFYEFAVFCME